MSTTLLMGRIPAAESLELSQAGLDPILIPWIAWKLMNGQPSVAVTRTREGSMTTFGSVLSFS